MKKNLLILICLGCIAPTVAQAYVGPGAGLSAIGSFLALIFGLFVALIGFVWYPIKRLLKGYREATLEIDTTQSSANNKADSFRADR